MKDSGIVQKSLVLSTYTYRELYQLLEEVGFCNYKGYGSVDLEPFTLDPRLYMATKTNEVKL